MSFMVKKKRFKFQTSFEVEELSSVTFVSGVVFVKLRLLDGGNFTEFSTREEVFDHLVRWKAKYKFSCKMVANANTGVLEPCICRVSVRKELKGGKSYQKLGFADINLAEYAGAGLTTRRYLLEGYDSKRRQDNSMLKVNVDMALASGDPCFKASHQPKSILPSQVEEDLHPENKGASEDYSGGSVASGSSGFGSLPRKREELVETRRDATLKDPTQDFEIGHSRNSSQASDQSKGSGYSSSAHTGAAHSRQSSYDGANPAHRRNSSVDSKSSNPSGQDSLRKVRKLEPSSSIERRVDSTRIDADQLIDELIKGTDFKIDDSAESSGLQLFVGKDGSTLFGTRQAGSQAPGGKFERVVIDES